GFREVAELLRHDQLGVPVERSHQQGVLAPGEGRIDAAGFHARRANQVVHGRGTVAALPELPHGRVENVVRFELSRPGHDEDNTRTIVQEQALAELRGHPDQVRATGRRFRGNAWGAWPAVTVLGVLSWRWRRGGARWAGRRAGRACRR